MPNQEPTTNHWPLALYLLLAASLAICAVWPNLVARELYDPDAINNAIMICGGCMLLMVAGLSGRVWMEGILIAISIGCCACLFPDVYDLVFYSYRSPLECLSGMGLRAPYIPAVVLASSSPLLILRAWAGWRLTRNAQELAVPRWRYGVEDLMLVTAIVASALFLLRVPDVVFEIESDNLITLNREFISATLTLFGFSLLLAPTIFIISRAKTAFVRYLWALVVFPTAVFGYVAFTSQYWDPFATTLATVFVTFGLLALRGSGFRLARYSETIAGSAATQRERDVLDDRYSLRNRILNRRLSLAFIFVALMVCFATGVLQAWRRQVDAEQKRQTLDIAARGGSVEFRLRQADRLRVDPTAGDDFLIAYGKFTEVTELSLAGTQITDTAISKLKQFANLNQLNLSGTKVTDACLDDLCQLSRLHELNVAGTSITRHGRQRLLSELKELVSLDVSDLQIHDDELNELPYWKLWRLGLTNNPITDEGLNRMLTVASPNRGLLDLAGTQITGGSLPNCEIERLALGGPQVTDASISSHLRRPIPAGSLILRNTSITDAILPELLSVRFTYGLEIGDCQISEVGFAQAASKSNLKELSCLGLTGKQFDGSCFALVQPNLIMLNMKGSGVNDGTLRHVAKLESLVALSLSDTDITDAGLAHLNQLSHLNYLDLANTRVTAEGLSQLKLPHCWISVASGQFTAEQLKILSARQNIDFNRGYFPFY